MQFEEEKKDFMLDLNDMVSFCENVNVCRHQYLKHYLSSNYTEFFVTCDSCDNCLAQKTRININVHVNNLLQLMHDITIRQISFSFDDIVLWAKGRINCKANCHDLFMLTYFGCLVTLTQSSIQTILHLLLNMNIVIVTRNAFTELREINMISLTDYGVNHCNNELFFSFNASDLIITEKVETLIYKITVKKLLKSFVAMTRTNNSYLKLRSQLLTKKLFRHKPTTIPDYKKKVYNRFKSINNIDLRIIVTGQNLPQLMQNHLSNFSECEVIVID